MKVRRQLPALSMVLSATADRRESQIIQFLNYTGPVDLGLSPGWVFYVTSDSCVNLPQVRVEPGLLAESVLHRGSEYLMRPCVRSLELTVLRGLCIATVLRQTHSPDSALHHACPAFYRDSWDPHPSPCASQGKGFNC